MSTDAPLRHPRSRSYADLSSQAKASKVIFRVHDALSASPLVWTGLANDSGFRSPHAYLSSLTPHSYALLEPRLLRTLYGRYTMVDHILRKWRQSCVQVPMTLQQGVDIPGDDLTPWISTSTDLIWCIWEIARRLSVRDDDDMYVDKVGLAVISYEPKAPHHFHSTLRDEPPDSKEKQRPLRGSGELHVVPAVEVDLRLLPELRPFRTVQLGQQFESAQRAARSSGEILFYGRIFPESIIDNLEFSVKKLPLDLPDWMFVTRDVITENNDRDDGPRAQSGEQKRTKAISSGADAGSNLQTKSRRLSGHHLGSFEQPLDGWLSRLAWDPRRDTLETCRDRISQRVKELQHSR